MARIYFVGQLCKEDLQRLIKETDWGEPRGKSGKHYKAFNGYTNGECDADSYDTFIYWKIPKELWGKAEPEPFIKGRTLDRNKHYWQERKSWLETNGYKNINGKWIKDNNNEIDEIF